jgi:hypothetical protein
MHEDKIMDSTGWAREGRLSLGGASLALSHQALIPRRSRDSFCITHNMKLIKALVFWIIEYMDFVMPLGFAASQDVEL